ncbi:hypothetical protein L5515_018941 [Caenorhabditis briggsae]|uniref:Uncharacterized protein n=1 Tax=Caenorhabditis briggsae TaxID=6238 RepID=A0AAE9JSJ0_CAEBR|nr:hypothetical protein L5515_018941 [Caenorhabditis briggsae]
MPKPSKNHLSDVQFYTRFDVHAYGLNVFRAELFFLIDRLKFTSQTVEEHDLICDKACARAIRRMEYAIDSGFEEVEDKHADRLDAVKHLVYVQCFTVGHNFYKLLANHTRETLGEDMKPYLFCKQFSLPCEGNEKIKNRENRQEVLSEVFQTSTRGMIERFEKNRMYEDCVLADVHASAIDEFRVKLEDDMEEDMEREMNSVQLEAYCCYNYHEAYNSMIEEIDRMFAELKADSAETRHWVLSSKEMVIKRCRVEATEFFNRYHDYWNDLLAAEKENREIDTFDIDPRLKIMLRESRKRINKSKTERAGLELAENLKRNFNCENPKDFWNTSSQKKFNNLAYRPEVEGTIAKEVQNQYGKHVQEKMYAVSSDVQNLNVEAPKKKNEQSRKEVKASVQSSLQGSSTQSTSGPQRIAEEVQIQYENQVQGKMNAVSSDVQNLNVEAPKKKNEQSRKEVKASVQSSLQGSSTQSTSAPQRIAEEVQNQYENQVQGKMNAVSSDVQNLNVEAPKKKNEQFRDEVKAPVQSSQQGSSTQNTSRAERAQRLKTSRLQRAQRSRNYTYLQNLQRQRTEENAAAQSARTSNQNAQVPTQNRESVRPPIHPEHRTDILAKMIAKCSISK